MKRFLPTAIGLVALGLLAFELLRAVTTYKWVDWHGLYGREPSLERFICDWLWGIEAAIATAGVYLFVRANRLLAFGVVALPQILMLQHLHNSYIRTIWMGHGNIYIDGREVPSHNNSSPAQQKKDVRQ
ncbi:MAG: hypothetical protein V4662_03185 [Verrucomicrobiota bacterium]